MVFLSPLHLIMRKPERTWNSGQSTESLLSNGSNQLILFCLKDLVLWPKKENSELGVNQALEQVYNFDTFGIQLSTGMDFVSYKYDPTWCIYLGHQCYLSFILDASVISVNIGKHVKFVTWGSDYFYISIRFRSKFVKKEVLIRESFKLCGPSSPLWFLPLWLFSLHWVNSFIILSDRDISWTLHLNLVGGLLLGSTLYILFLVIVGWKP